VVAAIVALSAQANRFPPPPSPRLKWQGNWPARMVSAISLMFRLFFFFFAKIKIKNIKKTYLFDFRRINIYFLFCRTNGVCDLIFV
jgi:hypothetical protein